VAEARPEAAAAVRALEQAATWVPLVAVAEAEPLAQAEVAEPPARAQAAVLGPAAWPQAAALGPAA